MVTEENLKKFAQTIPKLVAADRCDKCKQAQAYARWINDFGHYLDFCMHHSNEYEPGLLGKGFYILEDNRPLIGVKSVFASTTIDGKDIG
jgi:hypothetical protein